MQQQGEAERHAVAVHQRNGDVAAGHRERAMREVDEPHQPHGHRQPNRDDVQDHRVGEAKEQNADQRLPSSANNPLRPAVQAAPLRAGVHGTVRARACPPSADRSGPIRHFGWLISFHGSLTIGMVSISTLASWPFTFSTRRRIFVLHDVARLGIDQDRAARAVVILPALQQLHCLVRIDLAFLRVDDMENRRHAVIPADHLEARLLVGPNSAL